MAIPEERRPGHWQVQEAKQKFSEVLRQAQEKGPQIVTRHGEEVAVVADIGEYRRMKKPEPDFDEFLLSGPSFEDLDLTRPAYEGRDISFLFED